MALGRSLVSLTPVGSVLTFPMLDVRLTTVADAMQSTTMREETISLDSAALLLPHVRACTHFYTER